MLDMLTLGWPELNPTAISMDFEIGLMNSFAAYFPEADIHGCFFHLVQNMKKQVAAAGLSKRYRQEADFAHAAKMITALAFIPPPRVEDAVCELQNGLPPALQPILDYFEDNYLGRLQVRADGTLGRRTPLFPVHKWTVYDRTPEGDSRTNNYAEAFHKSLQGHFAVDHPALLKFIDGIRAVQHKQDAKLERYISGRHEANKRNAYVENDKRIMSILERLEAITLREALRGLAHTYEMDP